MKAVVVGVCATEGYTKIIVFCTHTFFSAEKIKDFFYELYIPKHETIWNLFSASIMFNVSSILMLSIQAYTIA